MDQERKKDLSIFYWLTDLFIDSPFINIKDGFPVENLVLPTIAVETKSINLDPFELGNKNQKFLRSWYIEIFATTKSQRDEYSYKILRALQDSIPVNDYDEGFPPDVEPTQIGYLLPEDIRMDIIKVMPQLVSKLYYRATISFIALYSEI